MKIYYYQCWSGLPTNEVMFRSCIHDHGRGAGGCDAVLNHCYCIRRQAFLPIIGTSKQSGINLPLNNVKDKGPRGHVDTWVKMQINWHCLTVDMGIKGGKIDTKAIRRLSNPAWEIIGDALNWHYKVWAGSRFLSIYFCKNMGLGEKAYVIQLEDPHLRQSCLVYERAVCNESKQ